MTKRQVRLSILFTTLALAGCVETGETLPDSAPAVEEKAVALRAKTDLARGVRWELRWGSVAVYDVATARQIRLIKLPGAILSGAAESGIPDIVLDRQGAAVISSNITTRIWRISPARFEVEVYDIEPNADRDKDFGFTSLVFRASELHAAGTPTGTLWRIDLMGGQATKVAASMRDLEAKFLR